jgi:hypothetical protein
MDKPFKIRRNNIILYGRIQARFKELFHVQKLRYDYTLEVLGNEFCKAEGMDLPAELPAKNPNQIEMF